MNLRALRELRARGSPQARVLGLIGVLLIVGLVTLYLGSHWFGASRAPLTLPWWAFVPAFMAAEALVFHVEIRDEAHSFSLSELPLVIGFFFAAPWAVVVGRVLGHGLFILVRRRQEPLKLAFNLTMFLAETASSILVFHVLSDGAGPTDPWSWAAVLAGVATADALSLAAVSLAIHWHGGRTNLASVAATGTVTAAINTSLAILACVVLWVSPWAMALFGLVALAAALGYRGYVSLTKRYSSLQLLYDFTRMVGASVRAEAVMDRVLAEARNLLRAGTAEIVLADRVTGRPGQRLRNEDGRGALPESGAPARPDGLIESEPADDDWMWQRVVRDGHAVLIPRTTRDANKSAYLERLGIRDCVLAPLRSEERVIGTIMVANRLGEVSTFDDQDLKLFETLANHATVAFENGRLVEQLRREADERRHEALHDALTGLPNRTLFIQRVEELTSAGRSAIVMLMDLDRFKDVNDTLGHHNGDILLGEVARRLTELLGPSDTVARLGGDEFAVLLPDVSSRRDAVDTGSRIVKAVRLPFLLGDLSLEVGASIGIVLAPDHGHDPATLLQRADVAMYEAKAGKSALAFYSSEKDNYSPKRLALAAELRQAIEAGTLLVYHQPQARLTDGQIIGTEALVRWRHPEHGLLPPDEFIPVAEHSGLISALTTHVLRSSLAQCRVWNELGYGLGVSVNLAVRSLLDTDLPDQVLALLTESGVSPERLTLEITESGIMADPPRTISVLERLAGIGVCLSIDDFGTGYSSLSYLQRLPVHEVKVDRSFVFRMASDASDATIVQSIIELGHNLGLRTVAEGVEDQISWDRLRAMGCDVAQGYHLSKPVPASEVTRWLAERRRFEGHLVRNNYLEPFVLTTGK